MAKLAKGEYYWGADGFPITAKRIAPGVAAQHPYDLTGTPHMHDFSELILIGSGSGVQRIDGVSYQVSAGDIFLLSGYTEHFFEDYRKLEHYNVMFDPEKLPLPMPELGKMPGFHAFFVLEPAYRLRHHFKSRLRLAAEELELAEGFIKRIIEEDKTALPGSGAAKCGLLISLLVAIARNYQRQPQTEKSKSLLRLGKLLGALESRCADNWTLDGMAKLAGMSKSNLLVVFKKATGESPCAHLLGLRLKNAARLLRSDANIDIATAALRSGFTDSNYFTRQFKSRHGLPPRQWRRTVSGQ
jgi:AraC-like DNA-binding protein